MLDDDIRGLALMAAEAAEAKKAINIQVLNVSELTVIADYFLICSGSSVTQVKAIARGIEKKLSEEGFYPKKKAGVNEGRWILLDYENFIVHVFHENERKYYELERLWADAEQILSK
jgi:ribosome-associated protein